MLFGTRLAPLLVSHGPEWDGGNVGATVSGNSPSFRFPGSRRRSCVCLTPNGEVGGPPGHPGACSPRCDAQQRAPRGRGAVSQACRPVPLTETRVCGGGSGPSAPGETLRVPHRAASSAESAGIRPRKRGLSLPTQRLE